MIPRAQIFHMLGVTLFRSTIQAESIQRAAPICPQTLTQTVAGPRATIAELLVVVCSSDVWHWDTPNPVLITGKPPKKHKSRSIGQYCFKTKNSVIVCRYIFLFFANCFADSIFLRLASWLVWTTSPFHSLKGWFEVEAIFSREIVQLTAPS